MHAIGFAPESCLGGGFLDAPWEDVAVALQVSAYSLKALAVAALPLMARRAARSSASTSTTREAWPVYDWMGVAKAAFESTARYLARDLGPEGDPGEPRRRRAAAHASRPRASPGFEQFEEVWGERAPLGWDVKDPEPVAKAVVALLSDWFPATTGEIIHVDGGYHAVGA